MNREELLKLYQDTVNNLEEMKKAGEINEAQFSEYIEGVDQELNQGLSKLKENTSQFSNQDQNEAYFNSQYEAELAEISESDILKNRFGAALLELGGIVGEESVDDLILDLMELTDGATVEDVAAILTGDALPDEQFVQNVVQLFELTDDEAEDLMLAAEEAYQEMGVGEEDEYEEDLENYSHNQKNQASFNQKDYSEVNELKNKLAEFEQRDKLKDIVTNKMQQAQSLVQSGDLPPFVAEAIIGNFDLTANERVAQFNNTANKNNVSLESQLHAADVVLDVFSRLKLSDMGMFDQYADDQVAEFEASEDQQADQLAYGSLTAFKKQNAERLQ